MQKVDVDVVVAITVIDVVADAVFYVFNVLFAP